MPGSNASYFGVIDRGLPQPSGPPIKQGGHEAQLLFTALLPGGWRAVADLDQLTSLTFRLAFSETFVQAVNSEVRNTAFLTNNFRGFSLNLAALSYENFLSATPQTSITLARGAGGAFQLSRSAHFQSSLPIFHSTCLPALSIAAKPSLRSTLPHLSSAVNSPRAVTMPLHWGPWLSVTPSFTFRSTYYGGQMGNGAFVDREPVSKYRGIVSRYPSADHRARLDQAAIPNGST